MFNLGIFDRMIYMRVDLPVEKPLHNVRFIELGDASDSRGHKDLAAQREEVRRLFGKHEIIGIFRRTEFTDIQRFGGAVEHVVFAEIFIIKSHTTEGALIHLALHVDAKLSATGRTGMFFHVLDNVCHDTTLLMRIY